jgi:hypothetical protein
MDAIGPLLMKGNSLGHQAAYIRNGVPVTRVGDLGL